MQYVYISFTLIIALNFCRALSGSNNEECANKIIQCEKNNNNKRPICGSDNQTYSSRCHLLRNNCEGNSVTLKHKGPCDSNSQPCFISRRYAMSLRKSSRNVFVPKCKADGTYAATQCHSETGCWCVSPMGKPLQNTSVRNGRPNCGASGKSLTRRRSSSRGQRTRRSCSRADRIQFNKNLIQIFAGEYERTRTLPSDGDRDMFVIEWKFSEMDKNKNGALDKPEYRALRRLIKKVVKPKRCAKTFIRVCDMNHDEVVLKQEWSGCLTGDGLNYEETVHGDHEQQEDDYGEEEEPSGITPDTFIKMPVPGSEELLDRTKDEMETNDCLTDRKIVLEQQKDGDLLYAPECTSDGRYQRVQCYHSTGYCWCVHEDTGKPIPGSSVKDQHPKCEALPSLERPMKGCPEPIKTNFLHDLMQFLFLKMSTSINGTINGGPEKSKWQASREEQVSMWTFVMLDKDKNKVLDRREWKMFHNLINGNVSLKKCGRKLPRFCDINHDRKISIAEWLMCLNAKGTSNINTTSTAVPLVSPSITKRRGPNPLESILKADD